MHRPKQHNGLSSFAATRKKIDVYRDLLAQKQQRHQRRGTKLPASKVRAPGSPESALEYATEKLHLLADLVEAHFIDSESYLQNSGTCHTLANRCEELQRKAISLARTLAQENTLLNKNTHYWVNANVKFQHLYNTLIRLKSFDLCTSYGEAWSDIIRPIAREAANAYTQHYQLVCGHPQTEDEFDAETQMRYKSITGSNAYAALMEMHQKKQRVDEAI